MSAEYVAELERIAFALVARLDREPGIGCVIRGDASHATYVNFLIGTYQYVRWSGFLLAKTAEGLRRTARCGGLHALAEAKCREEAPHDAWALSDLSHLGVNVELVKGSVPAPAIQLYYGWNAWRAEEGSPAFLGTAYVLETISMQRAHAAANNLRAHGCIRSIERAVSFLDGHGAADHGHVAELGALLASVEDSADQSAILLSARVTCELYPAFFARQ